MAPDAPLMYGLICLFPHIFGCVLVGLLCLMKVYVVQAGSLPPNTHFPLLQLE